MPHNIEVMIANCLAVSEKLYHAIRKAEWKILPQLEAEYESVFQELEHQVAAQASLDHDIYEQMLRLEQQQRRLGRFFSSQMVDLQEKIAVIDAAELRLKCSNDELQRLKAM